MPWDPDLLVREEVNLRPGQWRRIECKTAPDARFLGVMGAFPRKPLMSWNSKVL